MMRFGLLCLAMLPVAACQPPTSPWVEEAIRRNYPREPQPSVDSEPLRVSRPSPLRQDGNLDTFMIMTDRSSRVEGFDRAREREAQMPWIDRSARQTCTNGYTFTEERLWNQVQERFPAFRQYIGGTFHFRCHPHASASSYLRQHYDQVGLPS